MLTITFRADPMGQATAESGKSASAARRKGRGIAVATGVALAASLLAASGAQAQNCTTVASAGAPSNAFNIGGAPAAISSMVASTITASSTAFLLQSSSFIGAPANPAPGQEGGGIWVRGVGGEVTVKSTTQSNYSYGDANGHTGFAGSSSNTSCSESVRENFAGIQFGRDISELNVNGWNLHAGATAGYLGTSGTLNGGLFAAVEPANGFVPGATVGGGPFTTTSQIPFVGFYGAATNGGFFADGLLRAEYYQNVLNSPGANLFGQSLDAHGWSFSGSVGYNYPVPNSNWFVEPSASVVVSRVKVDPMNFTTPGAVALGATDQIPGTLSLNTIKSDIGRAGIRVGQTINAGNIVWQPFAAVSVWHEFAPSITSNYATDCPANCNFTGAGSAAVSQVGTFGQYSLGVSAAVTGTGWLGFARVDYRDGPNLQGLSGTGGIRYQFAADAAPARVMPVKAMPVKAPLVLHDVNWTGIYVGAFAGATLGTADWGFVGGEAAPHIGGFLGGGEIGADWQTGKWVIGAVADLAGTNTKGGMTCSPASAPFTPMYMTSCNASASWVGDVAARFGYAWDRVLFYAKAGGAWTNERFNANCTSVSSAAAAIGLPCTNPTAMPTTGFSASSNRTGLVLGYGAQFALTENWSAKAETDYISFGDRTLTASDGSVLRVGMHVWEEKVGLDYKFSTGSFAAK
jgi:outer membrane autotransporter protein